MERHRYDHVGLEPARERRTPEELAERTGEVGPRAELEALNRGRERTSVATGGDDPQSVEAVVLRLDEGRSARRAEDRGALEVGVARRTGGGRQEVEELVEEGHRLFIATRADPVSRSPVADR
jgi:hypothetical protein